MPTGVNLEAQIQKLVSGFVGDVGKLARQAAMDTLTTALADSRSVRATMPPPSPGRTSRASVPRSKGGKRPKGDIAALQARVAAHVAKHPGQRVEQINKVLGTTTRDLRLPLAKLIEARAVKTKGSRRATQYFPG